MSSFEIIGGKQLSGTIVPQGAKNEALQVICACLLTHEKITIHNIPNIRDVNKLIELLQAIGVSIEKISPASYSFQAGEIHMDYLCTQDFKEKVGSLRGSIMILGPMVGRFKRGYVYLPGGDKIGRRRLDTHFFGLKKLGATFSYDPSDQVYSITAPNLRGSYMQIGRAHV